MAAVETRVRSLPSKIVTDASVQVEGGGIWPYAADDYCTADVAPDRSCRDATDVTEGRFRLRGTATFVEQDVISDGHREGTNRRKTCIVETIRDMATGTPRLARTPPFAELHAT